MAGTQRPFRRPDVTDAAVFALAALAPDLDLLTGSHRGPTHGLGSACVVGLVAYLATRRGAFAAATAAAYGSHILLDWLGSDTTPPIGVMALWPFSRDYYSASVQVFLAISRRYWLPDFWIRNLRAVAREVLIMLPIAVAAAYLRRRP